MTVVDEVNKFITFHPFNLKCPYHDYLYQDIDLISSEEEDKEKVKEVEEIKPQENEVEVVKPKEKPSKDSTPKENGK